MLFLIFNLTVWQNIYVFDARTRGTNVLLLNNDTIIISGGYGNNFENTIVVKLAANGSFIDTRKTSDSRGGLVPGGYVIDPNGDIIITGEGILDQNANNKDVTILRISTSNLLVSSNAVIGLTGALKGEIGNKIRPYKSDTFVVGYRTTDPQGQGIGIAKIRVQSGSITYQSSRTYILPSTMQEFGGFEVVNDTAFLIGNGFDGNSYIYLINLADYSVLNRKVLSNVRLNDVKYYNDRFYVTGSYNNDVLLLKLDRNFNILGACYFSPGAVYPNNIDEGVRLFFDNQNVIILGNTNSFGDGYDTFVLVADTLCSQIIAQNRYGSTANDIIYDAYRSSLSIVAVGESDYSSPISIYAIRLEGLSYLSCAEKLSVFILNNINFQNASFNNNVGNINDKGNANFDFTSANPNLISREIICTPLLNNENKNCLKFSFISGGLYVEGKNSLEIYSLDGKLIIREQINGKHFIKLDKGIYFVNGRKVVIY